MGPDPSIAVTWVVRASAVSRVEPAGRTTWIADLQHHRAEALATTGTAALVAPAMGAAEDRALVYRGALASAALRIGMEIEAENVGDDDDGAAEEQDQVRVLLEHASPICRCVEGRPLRSLARPRRVDPGRMLIALPFSHPGVTCSGDLLRGMSCLWRDEDSTWLHGRDALSACAVTSGPGRSR